MKHLGCLRFRENAHAKVLRRAGLWTWAPVWFLATGLVVNVAAGARPENPSALPTPKLTQSASQPPEKDPASEDATVDHEDGPPAGARNVLRSFDIDDSLFAQLRDGRPLHTDERETLLRILYRGRKFDFQRWVRRDVNTAELTAEPERFRGEVFRIEGRLQKVTAEPLLPEQVERMEMAQFYRCEVAWGEGEIPAVLFSVRVPRSWPLGKPLDEPVAAYGFFLKLGGDGDQRPKPMFATPRIEWYPEQISPETGVHAGMTILANLGMDVALLDNLRDNTSLDDREGSEPREAQRKGPYLDREPFYQMLAAVERAKPRHLLREANRLLKASGEERWSVIPLFNEPAQQRGRLFVLSGVARRVVKVRVGDEDIQQRFGIDHYYEIDLYTDDSQGYPLVFCVRHLPPDLPESTEPGYAQPVRVAAFFFKKWAHGSERQKEKDPRLKQTTPLLIGREAISLKEADSGSNVLLGTIAGGVFVLAVLGIWLGIWRYNRADEKAREKTLAKRYSLKGGTSLDDLAGELGGTPDFEHLRSATASGSQEAETPGQRQEGPLG